MSVKGFDIKKFGVAHGEKFVLGIAGLLAILVLLKAPWGQYTKIHPTQMTEKAESIKASIAAAPWPEEESKKYPAEDVLGIKIASMLAPIPGDRLIVNTQTSKPGLAFELQLSPPLYVREKPLTDPPLFAVMNLVADPFRPVFGKRNRLTTLAQVSAPAGKFNPGDKAANNGGNTRDKFKAPDAPDTPVNGSPSDNVDINNRNITNDPLAPKFGPDNTVNKGQRNLNPNDPTAGGPLVKIQRKMQRRRNPASRSTGLGELVDADGRRAIAVRGLFPILRQQREYEKSLNLPEGRNPQSVVGIHDFILERSVSSDGGKTFGKWAKVDVAANIRYLRDEVADFETDVVAQRVAHFRITSPLPMRLLREWGDEATHPDLDPEKYKLTDEGRRRQELINQAVKAVSDYNKKVASERRTGGFGPIMVNMNDRRNSVMRDADSRNRFNQSIRDLGNFDGTNDRGELEVITNEATAAGDLVLFRYFDFDVLPGMTYKYRVRLSMYNPLYGKPPEQLAQESRGSNKVEFRDTPLSNETKPATIPRDVDLFVAQVDKGLGDRVQPPTVNMLLYQWMPDLGTIVKGMVRNIQVGQRIAGEDPLTERLNPAKEVLKFNAKSEFDAGGVVLDLRAGHRRLDDRHMKELGIPRKLKGRIASSRRSRFRR